MQTIAIKLKMYQIYSSVVTYSKSSRQADHTHEVDIRTNAGEEKIGNVFIK